MWAGIRILVHANRGRGDVGAAATGEEWQERGVCVSVGKVK